LDNPQKAAPATPEASEKVGHFVSPKTTEESKQDPPAENKGKQYYFSRAEPSSAPREKICVFF
jgi:hypothetical protein